MVPAPCALSAVMHCLIGSVLAAMWNRSENQSEVKKSLEELESEAS